MGHRHPTHQSEVDVYIGIGATWRLENPEVVVISGFGEFGCKQLTPLISFEKAM